MTKERQYIEHKLEGLLDSKKLYKKEYPNVEIVGTIAKTFKKQYGISEEDYDKFVENNSDIPAIKAKYTKKRKKGFGDIIEFYDWYKKQPQKCHYCETTQDELTTIFDKKISSKKFTAILHIERLDSDKGYNKENCRLACSVCNNAKSDFIGHEDFDNYFKDSIRKFLKAKHQEAIHDS